MRLPVRCRTRLAHAACLILLASAVPAIAPLLAPQPAEARAGGSYGGSHVSFSGSHSSGFSSSHSYGYHRSGGGSNDGAGIVSFLMFLLLGGVLIGAAARGSKAPLDEDGLTPTRRARMAELLAQLAEQDPVWREEAFLEQAKETFMQVQRAWVERNQDIAREVMTPALYAQHKHKTDAMIGRGEKNVLERLEITGARVVYVGDRLDDSQDEAWVQFTARAFDYLVSEYTGRVLEGQKDQLAVFKEIWKFKRDGRTWRVDAIETNELLAIPPSFSEAVRA